MTPLAKLERAPKAIARGLKLASALATRQPLPFSMTFILTHRCNFQCVYCDIPAAAGQEMTEKEFCGAIDELAAVGLARASFSGGEALMRRDATNIIRHAHSLGLTTSLNSNGWLTERHLDELQDCLDMLVISLDGPEQIHDRVRRQRGAFDRVIRVLDAARKRNISTATITVLCHENLSVIESVLALGAKYGFYAYFQPAYKDCFEHRAGLDPVFNRSVLARIATRLADAKKEGLPVGASPGYLERLRRGPEFGDCTKCSAGKYFGTVMPDGTIVPCHLVSTEQKFPNGKQMGFANAFFSLPRPGPGPGCAISPYQETDMIFGFDPRAVFAAFRRLRGAGRDSITSVTERSL